MIKALFNFADDASGATAIEYALLALLIALPIIAALTIIGTNLSGTFNEVPAISRRNCLFEALRALPVLAV